MLWFFELATGMVLLKYTLRWQCGFCGKKSKTKHQDSWAAATFLAYNEKTVCNSCGMKTVRNVKVGD